MKKTGYVQGLAAALAVLFTATGNSQALVTTPENNQADLSLIRLHADRMSLADLLDRLGAALQADIYVVNPSEREFTELSFQDVPAIKVLKTVLRGQNYAVVYHTSAMGEQTHVLRLVGGTPAEPSTLSSTPDSRKVPYPTGEGLLDNLFASGNLSAAVHDAMAQGQEETLNQNFTSVEEPYQEPAGPPERELLARREEKLRGQIKLLEEQIASGMADKWYRQWAKIRGARCVVHPRKQLELNLKKLAELY
jgi:hypothetical protein